MRLLQLLISCLFIITFFSTLTNAAEEQKPKPQILLITGENNHDWRATTPVLRKILEDDGFIVRVTEEPAVLETSALNSYDAILSNYTRNERWSPAQEQALLKFVSGGKGLIIVHAANNAFPGWEEFERMIGLTWRKGAGHDDYGLFTVEIVDHEHSITKGLEDFEIYDERYHSLKKASDFHILAETYSEDVKEKVPMIFVKTYGKGRVFHTNLGHDTKTMSATGFIKTLQRGAHWVVEPVLQARVSQVVR